MLNENLELKRHGIVCFHSDNSNSVILFSTPEERDGAVYEFKVKKQIRKVDEMKVDRIYIPVAISKFDLDSFHFPKEYQSKVSKMTDKQPEYRTDGVIENLDGFEEFSSMLKDVLNGEDVFENIFDTDRASVGDAVRVTKYCEIFNNQRIPLDSPETFNGIVYQMTENCVTVLVFNGSKVQIKSKDVIFGKYQMEFL